MKEKKLTIFFRPQKLLVITFFLIGAFVLPGSYVGGIGISVAQAGVFDNGVDNNGGCLAYKIGSWRWLRCMAGYFHYADYTQNEDSLASSDWLMDTGFYSVSEGPGGLNMSVTCHSQEKFSIAGQEPVFSKTEKSLAGAVQPVSVDIVDNVWQLDGGFQSIGCAGDGIGQVEVDGRVFVRLSEGLFSESEFDSGKDVIEVVLMVENQALQMADCSLNTFTNHKMLTCLSGDPESNALKFEAVLAQ